MPNALDMGGMPPAPMPNEQQGQNALQPQQQQQPGRQPSAPTHGQTVAALRHFHAIGQELDTLLALPEVGRSDVKSQIIDGVTKLVASRILSPAQAVSQLTSVPDKPLDQRKWLQQHAMQAQQAESAVLDHHRAGAAAGLVDPDDDKSNPDNHMDDMSAIMGHYRG